MTDPTFVFASRADGTPEIVVNFGVFSGRAATEAEIYRLAQMLLERLESVEIVSEHRYEFDDDVEATIHQVRVELPQSATGHEDFLMELIESWAADCIAERRLMSP
jgi:hypothetical protein